MRTLIYFLISLFFIACSNDIKEVNRLVGEESALNVEIATDVEIFYSDSSYVAVKIVSPKMIRHLSKEGNIDEFPDGLHVIFYDEHGREKSWMDAKYAIRKEDTGKVYAENDVVVYNSKNDKLLTNEIVWEEVEKTIYTDRFVKIIQATAEDTLMGFGLSANQDFTQFEIKKSFSGVKKFENLAEKLDPKN